MAQPTRNKKFFIGQNDFTLEGQKIWLKEFVDTGKVIQFIIIDKTTMQSIGVTYLRYIDRSQNVAEYGIYIGELTEQGKGKGLETTRLMLTFAFEELKLDQVFLKVLANNEVAIKLYLKTGFIQDAFMKESVEINGVCHDIIYISIKNKAVAK